MSNQMQVKKGNLSHFEKDAIKSSTQADITGGNTYVNFTGTNQLTSYNGLNGADGAHGANVSFTNSLSFQQPVTNGGVDFWTQLRCAIELSSGRSW